MSEFVRLNATAESILKILSEQSANPENLAFVLKCDKTVIGENMRFLLAENYVCNTNNAHAREVFGNDVYRLTVEGQNYLSNLSFFHVTGKRQFIINVFNVSVSLIALVKAFWKEISEVLTRLMQ